MRLYQNPAIRYTRRPTLSRKDMMIVRASRGIAAALFALALLARGDEAPSTGNDPLEGVVDGVAAFVNDEAVTIRDVMVGVPAQLKAMAESPDFREKMRQICRIHLRRSRSFIQTA